ncbi:hypothetical protein Selin_1183 [Desulfurispirillum indicum S5]|uniref:Lipoprotein n=1 Tax=Desulfurispirillum indicum (strain ATCC BAA-1389 / DSM 22839 / S5) TaxID=653733 RepID=E6W4E4_DESIS|nr:hypothetical protein [Desulfurispirillum indicum]ADU65918.1 hypothetical protein Selin_1183 [Desulfurispirillum indicum S5]
MTSRITAIGMLLIALLAAGCAGKIYTGKNYTTRVTEYISMYPSVTTDFRDHTLGVLNFKPARDAQFSGRMMSLSTVQAFHLKRLFFAVEDIDSNSWFSLEPGANEEQEIRRAIEFARQERYKYIIVGHVRSYVDGVNESLINSTVRLVRASDGMTLWYGDVAVLGKFNAGLFDNMYPSLSQQAPNMSELALIAGKLVTDKVHEMYRPKPPDSVKPLHLKIWEGFTEDNGQWK